MGKFWDREGRLFGLINPVDLVVVILLVVVGWRIFTLYLPRPAQYRKVQVTIGVVIRNVPPYIADSIMMGQDMFRDRDHSYLGKITAKTASPAELILADHGKLWISHSPQNLDVRLILRRTGRIRTGPARAAVLLGKAVIRIGDRVKSHTLYTSVVCDIVSLHLK
ncbi:MAG TPA: DUF4330 family protein [Bacillota bacterium]|nr:DUF4330 family protein [Bacillota bacterium]